MTFDKGSLILVDYTARVKDSEEVFDTTLEEEAKKHLIHDRHTMYQPKLVSVDELSYPVLKGLDEALTKATVGEKLTVEVTPDKGFGKRDPGKVRMIPIRKLGDDADKVSVGDTIIIDNKTGIIRFMGSGRVQVDYNHKYAGKTILYDVTIVKSLDSTNDKIDSILQDKFSILGAETAFDLKDNQVTIPIPEKLFRTDGLQTIKHFIQTNIFKFVPTLTKVTFVESHINSKPQSQTEETQPEAQASEQTDA